MGGLKGAGEDTAAGVATLPAAARRSRAGPLHLRPRPHEHQVASEDNPGNHTTGIALNSALDTLLFTIRYCHQTRTPSTTPNTASSTAPSRCTRRSMVGRRKRRSWPAAMTLARSVMTMVNKMPA